jgi:hypothetical protein
MKRLFVKTFLLLLPLISFGGMHLHSQTATSPDSLEKLLKIYKAASSTNERTDTFSNPGIYVGFLVQQQAMHDAEASRIDKQTETSSTSGLSTSAVTKGSVPWLFAVAVEHGALTQSVDGNVITFKGNVANAIKAISAQDYVKSFKMGEKNLFIRNVSRASFGISFNSSSGNASPTFNTNTLASANAHIDLHNHRDPRDAKWSAAWMHLSFTALQGVANARGAFTDLVETGHTAEFKAWQARAMKTLSDLPDNANDDQIRAALKQIGDDLATAVGGFADVRQNAKAVVEALGSYNTEKKAVMSTINKDAILSLEYTYTNQNSLSLPTSSTQNFAVGSKPPNLSNINLIYTGYLGGKSQGTLNASTTLFTSTPAGSKIGTVRDYRLSGQVDVPMEIHSLGNTSLSFSFLFLSLLEEPLGQQVLVNSVPISTRGNVNLLQAKWTIPMGDAGFKVPISITRSNRTELIKENDVRGTIGISYDFDGLFSKPK